MTEVTLVGEALLVNDEIANDGEKRNSLLQTLSLVGTLEAV